MATAFQPTPFARDLLRRMMRRRALLDHGTADTRTSPLLPTWQAGLHPAIVAEAEAMVRSGSLPLHDYAHALNSSQAFALNLFLPLRVGDPQSFAAFLSQQLDREVSITGLKLEFYGSGDLLAEIPGTTASRDDKLTQADVAVHLRDEAGHTGLLLIEVKLSEGGFTACGGATSRGHRDLGPCDSATTFLADPIRCYLRRPYRAARDRRYWEIFVKEHGDLGSAFPGIDVASVCPFRGDWQQPMRNHALGLAVEQAGVADFWSVALVHHDENPDVDGPWDAYRQATTDGDKIHRWPASELLSALGAAVASPLQLEHWLRDRYLLPEAP